MSAPNPGSGLPSSLPSDYAILSHYRASNPDRVADDSLNDHAGSALSYQDNDANPGPDRYTYSDPSNNDNHIGIPHYGSTTRRTSVSTGQRPLPRIAELPAPPSASESDALLIPRIRETCDEHETNDLRAWWEELNVISSYTVPVFA